MGKALIIKGADFSFNGISHEFVKLAWIGASTSNREQQATPNGQFISSGVMTGLNVKMEITTQLMSMGSSTTFSAYLPGCEISNQCALRIWPQVGQTAAKFGVYETTNWSMSSVAVNGSLWDDGVHNFVIDRTGLTIDGVSHTYDHDPTYMIAQPIYLDSCAKYTTYNTAARDGNTPMTGKMRIKNVKIWSDYTDESSLIMDAIPVKRISDNTVCFYNKVDGSYKVRNNGSTPDYSAT